MTFNIFIWIFKLTLVRIEDASNLWTDSIPRSSDITHKKQMISQELEMGQKN